MTKFISKNDIIVNMDNLWYMNYFRGAMTFIFNFNNSPYQQPAVIQMICSNDEYEKIVDFMKSKDENYLEL